MNLFDTLESIASRPEPFSSYTAETLWNDDHISKQMLRFHLDQNTDLASRKIAFIDESVAWMADRSSLTCVRSRRSRSGPRM